MSEALLPPSAGPFTRALAYTFDTYGRQELNIETIKGIGITDTPDDWVPWLVYDLGLEDVIPYVRGFRKVLAEGPAWQVTRGTDRGIEIGLGWVESEGKVAPPDGRHQWWKFQIAFERPVDDNEQLRQLDGIVRLSKASEDELFRMYSPGRDHRPVRMDRHRADRGGLYDKYSGVQLWDGGPLISFGWVRTFEVSPDMQATIASEIEIGFSVRYFAAGIRYDHNRFGPQAEPIITSSIDIDTTGDVIDRLDHWPSIWPKGSWSKGTDTMPIGTPLEVS